MGFDDVYPTEQLQKSAYGGLEARPRTKLERLHDKRKGLEQMLEVTNKAIALLESEPKLTEIIDALEKAGV